MTSPVFVPYSMGTTDHPIGLQQSRRKTVRFNTITAFCATAAVAGAMVLASSMTASAAPADTTAPTVVESHQSYESKEGGRTKAYVTFDEPIALAQQGWYGDASKTTWNKVYYSSKPKSAEFEDAAGNSVSVNFDIDATAPGAPTFTQVYQAKEGGRTLVTLTFGEPIVGSLLGQGWNGSGTTWSKVYYSDKTVTVNYTDLVGYPGSYTFSVDGNAPTASAVQTYQAKEGGRTSVAVTLSEPIVGGLGQGWIANASGLTYTKVIYGTNKTVNLSFVDAIGYPGSYSFVVVLTPPAV